VLQLLARGRATKEIAALLTVSPEEARARVNIILEKLQVHSRLVGLRPNPTPPPAASAALAVPFQRAEDIPRHVGRPLRRKPSGDSGLRDRLRGGPDAASESESTFDI
jgi:hypothetical protein